MSNIGTFLKHEISKLARRQIRGELATLRRASAQYRRDIAALKRQSVALARQVSLLATEIHDVPKTVVGASVENAVRFAPKGLRAHRERLGLSVAEYGRLAGVSAQSIYNWEQDATRPREQQRTTLAALRSLGKRQAQARLVQIGMKGASSGRKQR